jgi:hypothetical protein
MTAGRGPPTFQGRKIGLVLLVVIQLLVGLVHMVFGVGLFVAAPDIYSVYTIVFSVLTVVFAVGLWKEKKWGWVGTVSVAVFVIVVDLLTMIDLPSIPGIPKFAGYGEIPYSAIILAYLLQAPIRTQYYI